MRLTLPSQPVGLLVLQRLLAATKLLHALSGTTLKAGAALSAQVALTFFMPLCLACLACIARIKVLLSGVFKLNF